MKKALIFEGKLIEVAAVAFPVAPAMQWIDVADTVTLETHEYDGVSAALKPPPPPPPVPTTITMRQARLALLGAGLLASVNTAVAAMAGAAGEAARIEWEFSSTVERNKPLVTSLSAALGLTSTQLDALFTAASKL